MLNGTLEITTMVGCAINCKYCPQEKLFLRYKTLSKENIMSMDTFRTCINKVPSRVAIHFSGFCEPWQNKNCTNMLLYAFQKGHPIQVFSTLQGMSIEDFNQIKYIPFDKFIIHLPDKQRNSKFRIDNNYLEVLKYVIDFFKSPHKNIYFGASCHGEIDSDIEKVIPVGFFDQENSLGIQQEMHDRAGCLDFDELEHKYSKGKITCGLCSRQLNRNVLLPDGTVSLCCMDYKLEFILGNLLINKYKDLFNSSVYRKLLVSLEDENYDVLCRHCIIASPVAPDYERQRDSIGNEFGLLSSLKTNLWKSKYIIKIDEIFKLLIEYWIIRKSNLFDCDYYLFTNPDVKSAKKDPIIHFIQNGWKEGRNPSSKFNSKSYLETNPDVKHSEINPLIHYIKNSQIEVRNSQPIYGSKSFTNQEEKTYLNTRQKNAMKFGLVVLIKNEQDILNAFLNHIDALFDFVILIDHRSVDNSTEILKKAVSQRMNWTYISLDVNGYYQKEAENLVLPRLFEIGVDFVFFLDCDEFVQVQSRKELEETVVRLNQPSMVGNFRWNNCINDDIHTQQFENKSSIYKCKEQSPYSKVLIPRSVYEHYMGKIYLSQGNHQVLDLDGKVLESFEIGNLIHIPIRSRKQLINKAIRSSMACIARSNSSPGESFQFFKMLEMIANGEISDDMVRGSICLYQNESKIIPISKSDLNKSNYLKTSLKELKIATSHKFSFGFDHRDIYILERNVANQILSWGSENPGKLIYDQKEGRIYIKQ